jgi:hypothetical protein
MLEAIFDTNSHLACLYLLILIHHVVYFVDAASFSYSSLNSLIGIETNTFDPRKENSNLTEKRFFGTSAAAANVAAVALLMLQASPDLSPFQIYRMLGVSAIDMNEPGFDFDTGYGFVNPLLAVKKAVKAGDDKEGKKIDFKARNSHCLYTE